MEIVKVDEKGRIIIPKTMREKVGVKEGGYVKIKIEEKGIIIEPLEPIADKYYGAFKITEWPEDLDEFVIEVMRKWWTRKST
ncbi:MAG: AbrB/MazE/SpoVT family DNA-binding domain-containing protein [Candidatus Methanomethylicia archaeon]